MKAFKGGLIPNLKSADSQGLNEAALAAFVLWRHLRDGRTVHLLSERIVGFPKPNPSDRRFSNG